ncbi:MAG: tetratricopeptide repeat protein [Caldilineaceae bacterium]
MNDTILLTEPPLHLEEQITTALKALRDGDLLALGALPLAHTTLVNDCFLTGEPTTTDRRGWILRALLCWSIDRLRPAGEPSWVKPAWRHYNILHHFYLEGARASTLAETMAIAEQTLYQLRGQAISALTSVVRSELATPENRSSHQQIVNADRYARLTSNQQQLLRLAAVFPGAAPVALLHTLAQTLGNPDALSAAHQLTLNYLMNSDGTGSTFAVHPAMRTLALTQLSPQERRLAHQTAAEQYAAQQNYLEAAHQWRASEQPERAARLLIDHQRDIVDNLQIEELKALLAAFRPGELTPGLWARLKILAGEIAEFTRNFPAALAEYQQALAAPDLQTKALAYYRRAKAFEQTNSDESLAHYARAVQLLETTTTTLTAAERLTLLGNIYIDRAWLQMQVRADLARAETDLLRARTLLDSAPALRDQPVWCDLYNALGEFYHRTGKPVLAEEHSWQAWLAANEVRDLERMSKTAHNLGLVYMDNLRQYDRALEYLRKSEDLSRRTGNRQMEALSAMSIGACHYWLGDLRAAITYYEAAAAIFGESGNRALLARTHFGLAEAYADLGEQGSARRHHQAGATIATELGDQGALQDFAALAQQHSYLAAPAPTSEALSTRQQKALSYVRQHGQITNREYQTLTGVAQKQSVRDLNELVAAQLLHRQGNGRATCYVLLPAPGDS